MKKILLVDDEQNVLNALRRELKDHYDLVTFDNPAAALEQCRNIQFDLVVADYKMPIMNGIEFLERFGRIQPGVSRLVLSGETDIDALIRMINETHIYRFLSKPWDKAELLNSIRQALAYRDTISKNRRQAMPTDSHAAHQTLQDDAAFSIVLAESDDHLLNLMSRGLTDESWDEGLYGVIQEEMEQDVPASIFKCVVESFRSGQAALSYVNNNHCDLVITAQTLSDMDGIKLLGKVRHISPNTARILFTTNPDKLMLTQAVNEAEVENLLHFHWDIGEHHSNADRQAWNLHQLRTTAFQALVCRELLLGNVY